ncbi:SIALI-17 repeat-containing surface protein, partial [Streptococcus mitis]|uniref:SIALI-17 repeat-containing surface protein n=1 Tax=Streptococcus mitis TaxID=28037 RepID=UPI0039C274F3
ANGELTIPNANLPESEANKVPTATEDGKLATAGESVSVPAKKMSAKGNPAVEFIVELPLPIVVPDSDHLTPQEIEKLVDEVKKSNPNTIVTADDKGNVTVTDQATGESVLIPVKDLTVLDFEPVTPTDKVPVKDLNNLSKDEQDKVKESVEKANPGKDVIVASDGNVTITNPETNVTHNIPRDELLFAYAKGEPEVLKNPEFNGGVNAPDSPIHEVPEFNGGVNGEPETQEELPEFNGGVNAPDSPIHEVPEFNGGVNGEPEVQAENPGYNGPIGTTGVDENGNLIAPPVVDLPEFTGGVNGELPDPAELPKVQLIITKWIDEEGNELKPADAKAPSVPGETNEAFEHGEIEGYVFVRTETKGDVVTHIFRKVSPARPIGDDHQEPATPSADTNPRLNNATPAETSATQPQAVLPNTGTKADRATGALGVLSLLGTVGLLFAKKKKDDEEEA